MNQIQSEKSREQNPAKLAGWQEHLIFFALVGESKSNELEDLFAEQNKKEFHQFSVPRKNTSAMLFIHLTPQKDVCPC
jgi:hypothetical protein